MAPKVALSEAEERVARARLAIIQPLVEAVGSQSPASGEPQLPLDLELTLADGRRVTTAAHMVEYLAAAHKISARTIWRWARDYRQQGLIGLARRQRNDKDRSRFFARYPEAANLAAYLYLEQRQSVRAAYEAIHRDGDSLGVPADELPSYSAVYCFLGGKAFSEPLKLMARAGRRVYRERCAPYISRDYCHTAANEIWVSDHMIHDVEVQNDCFPDAPWGAPIRLRFTCILDFRARYVVGCSWAWEGSSRSITTALRRAVTAHGPCDVFYCDNGKDYLKVGKGAAPAYLRESAPGLAEWHQREISELEERGILARLGVAVQHCIVRHPQSKHVERFFRTLHERLDKRFPTYLGGSPATRPDFANEATALHRKLLRMGLPGNSLHPPASMFIRMALAWIDEYHNTPRAAKRNDGMDGRTPQQVFAEERNPRQRPAPAQDVLALMLAERVQRGVRECSIELHKRRYVGDDEISATMMHEQNGREVVVAYDPLDLERVAILDMDGRLIAWAKAETYVTHSSAAGDAIADSMAQRRRLEKQTAGAITGIAVAARARGARSQAEHLAARAGINDVAEFVTQRPARAVRPAPVAAPLSAAEIAERALEIMEGEA